MSDNGMETEHLNGGSSAHEGDNGGTNGHSSSKHRSSSSSKHKSRDKDRGERRKETEEERRIRKEKERSGSGRPKETEEERRIRKEKEKERKNETEEERKIRKEKEREERHKSDSGKRKETDEERNVRKEKEREERKAREEMKKNETDEERRVRKEKERKDQRHKHKETDEERAKRKERERRERKDKERKECQRREQDEAEQSVKEEENDEDEDMKEEVKEEPEEEEEGEAGSAEEQQEVEDEYGEEVKQEQMEDDFEEEEDEYPSRKSKSKKRKAAESEEEEEAYEPEEEYVKPASSSKSKKKKVKKERYEEEEEEDFKPVKKSKAKVKSEPAATPQKGGKKVKKEKEGEAEVWKWWEETSKKKDDGTKWQFLEHKGPLFAADYEPLPSSVHFYYDGKKMKLSELTEETATFYGRMIDHDYTTKEVFNRNYFKDWRKVMTEREKETIRDLSKCGFKEIDAHFKLMSEQRKARGKEERKAEKEKNEQIQKEYGFCTIDGHSEKIGNFRIEPPGLFRGRGEHPKQGMLKKRVMPEEVIINCSKDSDIPQPPDGHRWKRVQHDNQVTWLASWTENIQNQIKYVMLNPSSKLKGEKDMMKYEKARQLKQMISKIRDDYTAEFKSKEMRIRQRSVALYFIDKLALRAGNEKDEDQADTVGCCSLRVEHITLHDEKDGKPFVVEFDFLGKDSIRYNNCMAVEKRVYKNVTLFMENKKGSDDLFDRLNTSTLNEYLNGLMPGLTAKVFRTYNASITLQEQLLELTEEDDSIPSKMLSYNRANRAVAILCNHQRAIPKTHDKSMANLQEKIEAKKEQQTKAEKEFKSAKKAAKAGKSQQAKIELEKKRKALERAMEQLDKLNTQAVDKEENKTIALGTSKLNYLDPRISVAWVKKYDVPIEKVYNKTQREKFRWAIDMAGPDYVF